ncbi:MAG: prediction: regulator of chromosome condensation [Pseudomonadota bacterium]
MDRPLILFGAFDRHNFGDLLLAQVAAAQFSGRELHFAGLADRDLRAWDGFAVRPLPELVSGLAPRQPDLLHVGGEILDCSAWQAAVMLLPPEQAQAVIAYLEPRPAERSDWVWHAVGDAQAPYVASPARLPALRRTAFASVGGVGLAQSAPALRFEVFAALRAASFVSVRDRVTQATLAEAGIAAELLPDPAVLVAERFGRLIGQRAAAGEAAALRAAFPAGYLALQLGPEFADDACLDLLAAQLQPLLQASGLGLALFRAGLAPWHDDSATLPRLAARLPGWPVRIMASACLWDICALIAHSRACVASSLHARIVATAFALPRLSLLPAGGSGQSCKLVAYLQAWELPQLQACVEAGGLASALEQALATDARVLQRQAQSLAAASQAGWRAWRTVAGF